MSIDPAVLLARKVECQEDGLYFNRYFFKKRFDSKMIVSDHHHAIQKALDRTMLPPSDPNFIPRLIVTVPPGYSKTEMSVINYMSRGLAVNPISRFLHLSYSHKLALKNSSDTKSMVKSTNYQQMWNVIPRADADSKEIWHTHKGGGVTASSAAGQVTGFRAGHMDEERFTGALLIDDPVKPDDAYSEIKREAINNRYNETIASRVAIETVPIIVIMQRIHWNDLAGYLLTGGSGEIWQHLDLQVIIDNSAEYPKEYTHGKPIAHGLPDGWLWPFKHNANHETALRAHRRRWFAQYMQRPIKRDEETALWTEATISRSRNIKHNDFTRTVVAVDPATTNKANSDEHGIVVASKCKGVNKYAIRGDYTCKGSPSTWAKRAILTYEMHTADAIVIETNQGGDMCEDTLRNAGFAGRIIRVHAAKGKVLRAEPIAALYEQGFVSHCEASTTLIKLEDEMLDLDPLTGLVNSKSPNRLDAGVYALTELSGGADDFGSLLKKSLGNNYD